MNLLCFAVTGSSVLGNRPVGMGGEGAYKHRHAHTIGEHRHCSSIAQRLPPCSGQELYRGSPSRKESGINRTWEAG